MIAKHHRSDGLGRLAAARLDLAFEGLDAIRRADLQALIGLPDVLPDVVPPSTGERLTTAYQAQVRDIAPDRLLDREEELDELVGFCAGDQPYAWWQAGPWAGKSALMAWFVLHPPAGVDVVSFFITARLADQSDSDACTDALIEQLAALVGESPANLLTAGARRGTMLRLLEDAADQSRERGRRLLLVIDGLDEDRSAATGPGRSSIAALLPRRLPLGAQILVASRPHPPIPKDSDAAARRSRADENAPPAPSAPPAPIFVSDVPEHHPLRTIAPRQLAVSEHARDVERYANLELDQLLAGSQLQRDVLGLITAAGGGLTRGDLEELTERPPYEIQPLLGGVFGRSVGSRTGATSAGYHDERVYLFAHETLHLVAEQQYGNSRLASYRGQLHVWTDSYRQRGWPADTPHYLLRSYPRMLAGNGDLTRLVTCATDQLRHDRMRNLTGGDALAFTEISTAQQLILVQPDPDLTSLALLAVEREHLTDCNINIPTSLPAVWAKLGQPTRAEVLANSNPDPIRRALALAQLAQASAAGGDHDRAARLAGEAEALTRQITDPFWRGETLAGVAHHDWTARLASEAEVLTGEITDPYLMADALARLAQAVAACGDHHRAEELTGQAVALTGRITHEDWRVEALARLTEAVAATGDRYLAEVFTITDNPDWRAWALARLAQAAAAGGDHDRAEILAGRITDPDRRAWVLARLAEAAVPGGDHDRAVRLAGEAEALTRQISNPDQRKWALARIASAAAAGGDDNRAARLASEAEALTRQISNVYRRAEALAGLAEAVAVGGDHDRAARLAGEAEALTRRVKHPDQLRETLVRVGEAMAAGGDHDRGELFAMQNTNAYPSARLVEAVAASGDPDRAEVLAGRITDSNRQARVLARLAQVVAAGGDHDRAARLADQVEALTGQAIDPESRAAALAQVGVAMAAGGDHDRAARLADEAETLAGQITNSDRRAWALTQIVEVMAAGGNHDRAARLAGDAEALTGWITSLYWRAEALARIAQAMTAGGDHDRAEALAGQITDPKLRAEALARVAAALIADGDHDRTARLADEAEALAGQITNPDQRAEALVGLARILVEASNETSLVPDHVRRSSPLMVRARRLLAEALAVGSWTAVVSSLARVDPLAVTALADDVQARWIRHEAGR